MKNTKTHERREANHAMICEMLKTMSLIVAVRESRLSRSTVMALMSEFGYPDHYSPKSREHQLRNGIGKNPSGWTARNIEEKSKCLCGCGIKAERRGEYNAICFRRENFSVIGVNPPAYELSLDKVMQTM